MHFKGQLSSTHEMYLKVLYQLQEVSEVGRVKDLAKGLGVSPGTVSAVLKTLERSGLVEHDRYGLVKLTGVGRGIAECIVRRYEVIKAFLTDILDLDEGTAEVDACSMEHAVSPTTINRIEKLVQLFRSGKVQGLAEGGLTDVEAHCADCEASGVCQAELALRS